MSFNIYVHSSVRTYLSGGSCVPLSSHFQPRIGIGFFPLVSFRWEPLFFSYVFAAFMKVLLLFRLYVSAAIADHFDCHLFYTCFTFCYALFFILLLGAHFELRNRRQIEQMPPNYRAKPPTAHYYTFYGVERATSGR